MLKDESGIMIQLNQKIRKEMTISQIEKELGYKIKIVNEE